MVTLTDIEDAQNILEGRVLRTPMLPPWLPDVRLENLVVGDAVVDLLVRRTDGSTGVEVLRRSGDLDVVVRV